MKLQQVPLEWVSRMWPVAQQWLAPAYAWSKGDYTLEQAQLLVSSGQWILFLFVADDGRIEGAATTFMYNRPSQRVAVITGWGGRGVTTAPVMEQVRAWHAAQGATTLEAAGRPGVVRLLRKLGFAHKYQVVGVSLWPDCSAATPAPPPPKP